MFESTAVRPVDTGFVAGFSPRHQMAADVLARAFAPPEGFAERPVGPGTSPSADPVQPRHYAPEGPAPRHFSPADPNRNATEGWDPLAAAEANGFVDPIEAARTAGYAEGLAAATTRAASAGARDRQLIADLSAALAGATFIDRAAMAERMRRTVLLLVTRMVGEIGIAGDQIAARVEAATDCLADASESALLHLNPADLPLVEGKLPATVFAVGDANVERGGFVIESASTIVEDGPSLWLEQLGQAIDRVGLPAGC